MPDPNSSGAPTPRVRFAPSPTGFLHVGSARTFIFNWLYARHNHGTMVLRLDDTDVERNTEASVQSIFEGLRWLGLDWDEEYKQSERLALHRQTGRSDLRQGPGLSRLHARARGLTEAEYVLRAGRLALQSRHARTFPRRERPPRRRGRAVRAALSRAPRPTGPRTLRFVDGVYGAQSKLADEVEDFALLRSDGMPTYHLASCVDDADLRISHIIRGQDHLTNTFKHLLIFEGLGVAAAAVRASASARRARRRQALQAQARARRQRDHLPRRRLSAPGLRQLSLPARLVAQERPRVSDSG